MREGGGWGVGRREGSAAGEQCMLAVGWLARARQAGAAATCAIQAVLSPAHLPALPACSGVDRPGWRVGAGGVRNDGGGGSGCPRQAVPD